jgi:uncharacterized protein DUF397
VMADTERLEWRRSARCDTTTCVEVARRDGHITVRDGKDPDGPWLTFTESQWVLFLDEVNDRRR